MSFCIAQNPGYQKAGEDKEKIHSHPRRIRECTDDLIKTGAFAHNVEVVEQNRKDCYAPKSSAGMRCPSGALALMFFTGRGIHGIIRRPETKTKLLLTKSCSV